MPTDGRRKTGGPNDADGEDGPGTVVKMTWSPPGTGTIKGVAHTPSHTSGMKPETRDAHLAIAKARRWVDDLAERRVASLHEIAKAEDKVERHIRLLAPLAFISPATVKAIAEIQVDTADSHSSIL